MMAQAYMLARYYAKRDLKAYIRRTEGYVASCRLKHIEPMALEWLMQHPELVSQAMEAIQKWSLQKAAKRSAATRARQARLAHTAIDPLSNRQGT
jgi:hypothetical protein